MTRTLAVALCLLLPTSAAVAHDWYSNLVSPTGQSCCSNKDCRPVDSRYNPESRRLELGIDGTWTPIDTSKIIPVPSADGGTHACFAKIWRENKMIPHFYCIILPGEA